MVCKCPPSLLHLRQQIDSRWPARDRSSDGCCGDAAHAARKSDHNPDASGFAHAMDIDEDLVVGGGTTQLLIMKALLLRDPRTKYVIYEGRIAYPDGTDKPYHGVNAHKHHLHLSIHPWATFQDQPWAIPAQPQEEELTPELKQYLDAKFAELEARMATGRDSAGHERGPIGAVVAKIDQRTGEIKKKVQA